MIANRLTSFVIATALLSALAPTAHAWERDRDHRHQRVENNRWDRQGDGRRNRPSEFEKAERRDNRDIERRSISRSISRGSGAYGGSILAYSVRGNGTYFVRDSYWPVRESNTVILAPKARIIDVEQEMGGNAFASEAACSFEAGVCVIRGN